MNKVEKRFVLYAVVSVFVLLTVLLGIINGINFTMAARDADNITQMIASGRGELSAPPGPRIVEGRDEKTQNQIGPMGPGSPEVGATMRYFTVAFTGKGDSSSLVAYNISAVDEEAAVAWARTLRRETSGWTRGTYRYLVYEQDGTRYVTVLDQGRELLSAYRILIFSVCGIIVGTLLAWLVLRLVGKKLFAPIEDADRKQKKFISNAEKEFKLPLTVISADTEIIERENGPSDQTRSIHRQVRKMDALVRRLASIAIFDDEKMTRTPFCLSDILQETLDRNSERFSSRGIEVSSQIEDDVVISGEPEAMRQAVSELVENALKYARATARFTLSRESGRVRLTASNGTELPDGSADQIFDRFAILANAPEDSVGLGLAYVRDIVKAHDGRVSAKIADGVFTLQLDL